MAEYPDDPFTVIDHRFGAHNLWENVSPEIRWPIERLAKASPFDLKAEKIGDLPPLDEQDLEPVRSEPTDRVDPDFLAVSPNKPYSVETARFDTVPVGDRSRFPYKAVGKLTADVNGVERTGTAWVVGERSIITAGHCVFPDSTRTWVRDLVFEPQFEGASGAGLWTATRLLTLAGWANQVPGNRRFDFGAVVLDRPIAHVTGAIGWQANISPEQGEFHSVGYPVDWLSNRYSFDGAHMWRCNGQQLRAGEIMAMANNMTRGCSGGPWLIARNRQIYANGLNSFRPSDEPEALASPFFGQAFLNLVRALQP